MREEGREGGREEGREDGRASEQVRGRVSNLFWREKNYRTL